MNYFEQDTKGLWIRKLMDEFNTIKWDVHSKINVTLVAPSIEINDDQNWGTYTTWNNCPIIRLSRKLLNLHSWDAIVAVFKHEIAHMLVDMGFRMGDLAPHGEAFQKACALIDANPSRLVSIKQLLTQGRDGEKIAEKIEKLIRLGESPSQAEAELALRKAHELMLKYNIEDVNKRKDEDYIVRPIGTLMKRVPNWMRDIINILHKYYFVNTCLCWGGKQRYFEIFGTKENVDLAEYIFYCLCHQIDVLWKEFCDKKKLEGHEFIQGVFSKESFAEGLVMGYSMQLKEEKHRLETIPAIQALVWKGDPLLDEMHKKQYPDLRTYHYHHHAVMDGKTDGYNEGKNLKINQGINNGQTANSRLLAS